MKPSLIAAILLIATTTAHADDPDGPSPQTPSVSDYGYVGVGGAIQFDAMDSGVGVYLAEGAVRIPQSPLLVHGLAGDGTFTNNEGKGTFSELRIGLEADSCTERGMMCGFVGLDLGHTWASGKDDLGMSLDASRDVTVARVGYDGGNEWLRVRVALEYTGGAVGLSAAFVHRFYAR